MSMRRPFSTRRQRQCPTQRSSSDRLTARNGIEPPALRAGAECNIRAEKIGFLE